jgi:tetratricopeptide (TPR) repeat protein
MIATRNRLAAICLTALLAGCAHPKVAEVVPAPAPPEPKVEAPAPPAPSLSASDRLELAVMLLKKGESAEANAELKLLLAQAPDNKQAQYLVRQIEAPVVSLFPKASFRVKLNKDSTLSQLAQTYLGNPLAFYGLARYNAIAVPAKLSAGQTIRIPKTATALAAKTQVATQAAQAAAQSKIATLPARSEADMAAQKKQAEHYYKRGLVAFQRQDLDGAIAEWDKVLAIDPDHKDAQLSRSQALQLKENLKKLGG